MIQTKIEVGYLNDKDLIIWKRVKLEELCLSHRIRYKLFLLNLKRKNTNYDSNSRRKNN